MATARDRENSTARNTRFPGIEMRSVNGRSEPYVREAGLAVWEIAWLARAYSGDSETLAQQTLTDRRLIEEGLGYAAEHEAEIDGLISLHTERPMEELLELLPGMRVITVDASESEDQHR